MSEEVLQYQTGVDDVTVFTDDEGWEIEVVTALLSGQKKITFTPPREEGSSVTALNPEQP